MKKLCCQPKPRLLILDEVTTALDPKTEAVLCSTILGLRGEMAILAISHQHVLIDAADLVYNIHEGEVMTLMMDQQYSIKGT